MTLSKYEDSLEVDDCFIKDFNYNVIPDNILINSEFHKVFQLADNAKSKGDLKSSRILYILGHISSFRLVPQKNNNPYIPFIDNGICLESLTKNDILLLQKLLPHISNTILKSRIADILWLSMRPKDLKYCHIAIDGYSSQDVVEKNWFIDVESNFERAITLAYKLGDEGREKLMLIEDKLTSALMDNKNSNSLMFLWICTFLHKFRLAREVVNNYNVVIYQKAELFLQKKEYLAARQHLEFLAKIYQESNNTDEKLILIEVAQSYESEGDEADSGMKSSYCYNQAIQAFRMVGKQYLNNAGIGDITKKLQIKIRAANASARQSMIGIPIDFGDQSKKIIASSNFVSGIESTQLALINFARITPSLKKSKVIGDVASSTSANFLQMIGQTITLSEDDRVVAKQYFTDDSSKKKSLSDDVFRFVDLHLIEVVEFIIKPALHTILKEHRITLSLLESLCLESAIVPRNREKLFANALYFGFEYDFSTSIHLLTPQIENFFRVSLNNYDVPTTHYDSAGIEVEFSLGSLFKEPKVQDVFDVDFIFEFEVLLTDSRGPNLRNEVAHGLLSDDSACRYPSIYLWWRVLKLVIDGLLVERIEG